jgi:hypothetical protein
MHCILVAIAFLDFVKQSCKIPSVFKNVLGEKSDLLLKKKELNLKNDCQFGNSHLFGFLYACKSFKIRHYKGG